MLRVQGWDPDGRSGCLSWSCECRFGGRNGVLHGGEMKTFITPLRRLVGWLRNVVKGGLDGIFEW